LGIWEPTIKLGLRSQIVISSDETKKIADCAVSSPLLAAILNPEKVE